MSVAAILNKHGRGELYFGAKPNGDACDQDVAESMLRQISQTLGSSTGPRIYPVVEEFDDAKVICASKSRSRATIGPTPARERTASAWPMRTSP